mgnify:CR=1 FL=1
MGGDFLVIKRFEHGKSWKVIMKILILLMSLLVSLSCLAKEPTDESIERLLLATGTEALVAEKNAILIDMWQKILDTTKTQQASQLKNTRLKSKYLIEANNEIDAFMTNSFGWSVQKKVIINLYKQKFSQEDIDKLIVFFETETGSLYKQLGLSDEVYMVVSDIPNSNYSPILFKLESILTKLNTVTRTRKP